MLDSPEGKKATYDRASEDIFKPEIVRVHSLSASCSRSLVDVNHEQIDDLQNKGELDNHVDERHSQTNCGEAAEPEENQLSEDEAEEIEKEDVQGIDIKDIENLDSEKNESIDIDAEKINLLRDTINNRLRFIFHVDGLAGGLLYIGCECDKEKTNPSKVMEWCNAEFVNLHRAYAIQEEEPFLLKVFTHNHEISNKSIRRKGGRKVMFMGKEVFGDVFLACGHCGYWSREGSNVRRHLKKSVCLKEKGYCTEELAGLDRVERRRFLRRVASAKCRAKKKAKVQGVSVDKKVGVDGCTLSKTTTITTTVAGTDALTTTNTAITTTTTTSSTAYSSCPPESSEVSYPECLVEIQEQCFISDEGEVVTAKRKQVRPKALMLGPVVTQEAVVRAPYDIFTINEDNDRVAWKPPHCHKNSSGDSRCQIVFKGARMRRRCLDLPVPRILIYRKLDCRTHHCNFTLFHPSARAAFHCDPRAKASIDIKMYGDIVMTQEFSHYFVSLLSIMKMKSCQTARHLTSVWEAILAQRLGISTIPDEYRKIITLSKQTVKSIWNNIEEEDERRGGGGGVRLSKGSRRRKKPPPAPPSSACGPPPLPLPPASVGVFSSSVEPRVDACGGTQPSSTHHCMKRLNPIDPKPPPLPPPPLPPTTHPPPLPHIPPSHHKTMMSLPPPPPPHPHHPPPHPSHHNPMQQAGPHVSVNHTHWLSQAPQYPHNMAPYPMTPHHPSSEYYPVPSHFMTQYTPAAMGTSP